MAKIKTVTEEYEYNIDGILIKKIITTREEDDNNTNPIHLWTPIGQPYPWQNPIIYGTGTGNPVPNYTTVTCQLEGQENFFDW
jgi:hypothetical protein